MARLFTKDQLPHFHSTRDTRDRLDLVTDNVPVGAKRLKADRIIYHPGDTCARHYHLGCHHVFVILEGEGLIFTPEGSHRLKPGMAAVVVPEEIHWFAVPIGLDVWGSIDVSWRQSDGRLEVTINGERHVYSLLAGSPPMGKYVYVGNMDGVPGEIDFRGLTWR